MAETEKQKDIKPPTKLYRIGEVVRCTPFTRQTIHNYTTMGLLTESEWTEGGHRLYDESVFHRLSQILGLCTSKTLAQIRRIIRYEYHPNLCLHPNHICRYFRFHPIRVAQHGPLRL